MSVPSTEPLFAGDPEGGGSGLPGPYPVGRYAARLREQLRSFTRVQLTGEIANLRPPTRARAYFELRDADGALPCAMWRNDWERLGPLADSLADGMEVVIAGGARLRLTDCSNASSSCVARCCRARSASSVVKARRPAMT